MSGDSMISVEINGLRVAYQRAGQGPGLVLLHGFSHDSRIWRQQVEGLSNDFTIIAWDAPGAGRSSDPPESFGIDDWVDSLAGVLDHAGIEQAHITGLSWGGLLAQEFYRLHPKRVRSLVLADTSAGWKGSLSEPVAQDRLSTCLRDAALPPNEFVLRYLPQMLSQAVTEEVRVELGNIMSEFHPPGFRLMAAALAHANTRELLPRIGVPTLLIWGDQDERTPISIAYQFMQAVPRAELAVIHGVGHVSNMEAPVKFNAYVRNFCLGVETQERH